MKCVVISETTEVVVTVNNVVLNTVEANPSRFLPNPLDSVLNSKKVRVNVLRVTGAASCTAKMTQDLILRVKEMSPMRCVTTTNVVVVF